MTWIGITGHQSLSCEGAWYWVEQSLRDELAKLEPPFTAVTSLAIGADQLLARLVLEKGGAIYAVLPFADIERSFISKDIPRYRELLAKAEVEVLEGTGTDQDKYLAAGHRVVDLSTVVIAIWDGLPAKGKGGTADVVAYALRQRVAVIHINPVSRTVHKPSKP
jgi:hypothetical protein